MSTEWDDMAMRVVGAIARMPGVVAASLGGSAASRMADALSDLDLHVYWEAPLASATERGEHLAAVADLGSVHVGLTSWGLEDHLSVGGCPVELTYRRWEDMRADVARAYREGLAGNGFTTAVLYAIAHGRPLHDPTGELSAMRDRLAGEFPEATRAALLRRQSPLLSFHLEQLRRAQERGDLLFAQHVRYKVQMLFFDVLFTLNRLYHPGEKRLLEHSQRCRVRPTQCEARWLRMARLPSDDTSLVDELRVLCGELCELVRVHGGVETSDVPL